MREPRFFSLFLAGFLLTAAALAPGVMDGRFPTAGVHAAASAPSA